jgi:hypothetical protein
MNNKIIIDNLKPIFSNFQFRELNEDEKENFLKVVSLFETIGNYSMVILSEAVEVIGNKNVAFLS